LAAMELQPWSPSANQAPRPRTRPTRPPPSPVATAPAATTPAATTPAATAPAATAPARKAPITKPPNVSAGGPAEPIEDEEWEWGIAKARASAVSESELVTKVSPLPRLIAESSLRPAKLASPPAEEPVLARGTAVNTVPRLPRVVEPRPKVEPA